MAAEEASTVNDESKRFLEDVKKGKARKFAMICKGTSIVSLVVFKKGSFEKRKKEAKESGKGHFYFGVVNGKGMDIRFLLARADGFDSAPVKSVVLKSFLDESAELKCKPLFEIVDAAPLVLDEDDPLVARFLSLRTRALAICESEPQRAPKINELCGEIGSFLEKDEPDSAKLKLDQLEALLGVASDAPTRDSSEAVTSTETVLADKLAEALKKLKPMLLAAIGKVPDRKTELVDAMMQAGNLIKSQNYAQAKSEIVALGKLLQSINVDQPTQQSGPSVDKAEGAAALFTKRLKELKPNLDRALAMASPGSAELRNRVNEMSGHASRKDFAQANVMFLGVAELVERLLATTGSREPSIGPSSGTPSDRVRFTEARLLYDSTRKQTQADLQRLITAARAAFANNPDFDNIDNALGEIATSLDGFDERLIDELDKAYNAGTSDVEQKHHRDAVAIVQEYQQYLDKHKQQLQGLDANPFIPVQIESRLRETLSNLVTQLA